METAAGVADLSGVSLCCVSSKAVESIRSERDLPFNPSGKDTSRYYSSSYPATAYTLCLSHSSHSQSAQPTARLNMPAKCHLFCRCLTMCLWHLHPIRWPIVSCPLVPSLAQVLAHAVSFIPKAADLRCPC